MRTLSLILVAAAVLVFVLGAVTSLTRTRFVWNMTALSLWRFSIGCAAFAIYALVYSREKT